MSLLEVSFGGLRGRSQGEVSGGGLRRRSQGEDSDNVSRGGLSAQSVGIRRTR